MEKGQQCETAKEAYRDQLTKTNNGQTLHYTTNFPQLSDVSDSPVIQGWITSLILNQNLTNCFDLCFDV